MTPAPRKAMILAAGFGTRMQPLSQDLPKPLMPLWGVPILEHHLRLLQDWGVREVVVNLHHGAADIRRYLKNRPSSGLRIALSFEPEILGTGGALRHAEGFFDDDPFWIINGDIAADLDPLPLRRAFYAKSCLAAVWLHATQGPRTVEMRRGLVTSFSSSTPQRPGTYTFCGLHLVSPRLLGYLPPAGFSTVIAGYQKAMANNEHIAGVCPAKTFWADLGTPEQYLQAHRHILAAYRARQAGARLLDPQTLRRARQPGLRVEGFAAIGRDVQIARGVRLNDSVIWNGAVLRKGANLSAAIVGRDVMVRHPLRGIIVQAATALEPSERKALVSRGWKMDGLTFQPLEARGSARCFARLRRDGDGGILMRYSLEREENGLYTDHIRFLHRLGLQVPAVLAESRSHHWTFLEDLGDNHLLGRVRDAAPATVERLYRRILRDVLILHEQGAREAHRRHLRMMPPFTPELYRWERDYFAEHFLAKHLGLDAGVIRHIRRELAGVAAELLRAPRVLVHRDLQSSNIYWRGGHPAFIDFQGMRLGAAVYDLASLLCDPYVNLPEPLQLRLLDDYARRTQRPAAVRELFWQGAVERLAQALGAYARLGSLPGMHAFLKHIPPALNQLRRALRHVPLPALQQVISSS